MIKNSTFTFWIYVPQHSYFHNPQTGIFNSIMIHKNSFTEIKEKLFLN